MRETWTYQVPPAGADASGLEEYVVETSDGVPVGKVVAVLDKDGERYVAFDRRTLPLPRDRRAVRWEDIEEVDHDSLRVRLRMREQDLSGALELDPGNQVENGEAEAARVTQLPPELTPFSSTERGPTDRPTYAGAIALLALAGVSLIVISLVASGTELPWGFALLAIPALFSLAAAVLAYRAYRVPYEP